MIGALAVFPLAALLWMMLCDQAGAIPDMPLQRIR